MNTLPLFDIRIVISVFRNAESQENLNSPSSSRKASVFDKRMSPFSPGSESGSFKRSKASSSRMLNCWSGKDGAKQQNVSFSFVVTGFSGRHPLLPWTLNWNNYSVIGVRTDETDEGRTLRVLCSERSAKGMLEVNVVCLSLVACTDYVFLQFDSMQFGCESPVMSTLTAVCLFCTGLQ